MLDALYADDLMLLSGSLTQLQKMLQLCEKQAQELDLTLNSKETLDNLKLNGCDVYWVDKLRYLGVFIVEDRVFKIDTYWITSKFYAAANAICYHTKNV